jgi:hypothetical protein
MIHDETRTLRDQASEHTKYFTQPSRALPTGTLRFWVARPSRSGPVLAPPVGIWRGLVDLNNLVWRK